MSNINDLTNEIYDLFCVGRTKEEICKKKKIDEKLFDKLLSNALQEHKTTEEKIKKNIEKEISRIKSDFSYTKKKSKVDNDKISDNDKNRKQLFELAKEMKKYKIPFTIDDIEVMQDSIIYADSLCTKDNLNIISNLIIKLGTMDDFIRWINELKQVHNDSPYFNDIVDFEEEFKNKKLLSQFRKNISERKEQTNSLTTTKKESKDDIKKEEPSKNNNIKKELKDDIKKEEPSKDNNIKKEKKSRKNLYGYYKGTEKEIVYDCVKEVRESERGDLVKKYYDEELNLIRKIEIEDRDTMYGSIFPLIDRKIAKKIKSNSLLKEDNEEKLEQEEKAVEEINELHNSSVIPVINESSTTITKEEIIENREKLEKEANEAIEIIAERRKEKDAAVKEESALQQALRGSKEFLKEINKEIEDTDNQNEDKVELDNTSLSTTEKETVSKEIMKENEVLPVSNLDNPINIITNEEYIKTLKLFNTPELIELTKTKSIIDIIIISFKLGYVDGKYFSDEAIINFLGIDEEYVKSVIKNTLIEYKAKLISDLDNNISKIINMDTRKLSLENIRKEDKTKKEEN